MMALSFLGMSVVFVLTFLVCFTVLNVGYSGFCKMMLCFAQSERRDFWKCRIVENKSVSDIKSFLKKDGDFSICEKGDRFGFYSALAVKESFLAEGVSVDCYDSGASKCVVMSLV